MQVHRQIHLAKAALAQQVQHLIAARLQTWKLAEARGFLVLEQLQISYVLRLPFAQLLPVLGHGLLFLLEPLQLRPAGPCHGLPFAST
eukprot:scaffold874_cov380-Prasinococcus_capsulatus_cf.AAC.4